MSFFSNDFQSDRCPGPITGNPLVGLCEKACVQVKKVFDACVRQVSSENVQLKVETCGCPPFTFVSARSTSAKGKLENLTVDVIDSCKNLSRVRADVKIPMEVIYVDAGGAEHKACSYITVPEDIIMCLPEASIMPFEFEAVVSAVAPDGVFNPQCSAFVVNACITVITKVVVEAELLIPTYGYCPIPPCQEFSHEVCSGFFELPLFPRMPKCCKK